MGGGQGLLQGKNVRATRKSFDTELLIRTFLPEAQQHSTCRSRLSRETSPSSLLCVRASFLLTAHGPGLQRAHDKGLIAPLSPLPSLPPSTCQDVIVNAANRSLLGTSPMIHLEV